MTPSQIFRAATLANAEALGVEDEIGTVTVGKRVNLLLVRKNPAHDIDAYNAIEKSFFAGAF